MLHGTHESLHTHGQVLKFIYNDIVLLLIILMLTLNMPRSNELWQIANDVENNSKLVQERDDNFGFYKNKAKNCWNTLGC